ncbi:MAG: ABC transporter substrate-binding protein [Candidatus Saccharimonadales bacterium]
MSPLQQDRFKAVLEKAQTGWRKLRSQYVKFIATHLKDRSLRRTERFVFGWLAVFALIIILLLQQIGALDEHYLSPGPAPGGRYVEGIVGSVGGINPLFPDGQIAEAANRLVFSGLFKIGGSGDVVADIAHDYEINEEQTVYTVNLRDDVYWHDGEQLTASDVAYTVGLIQNPDVGSHLQLNWQDIEVEVLDELRIAFTLPNPYAPFIGQLTVGILPEHALQGVEPERLRVSSFNNQPIGSGPFMFDEINNDQQVRLRANSNYYKGPPMLNRFIIAAYETEAEMVEAYNRNELGGMVLDSSFNPAGLQRPQRSTVSRLEVSGQVFAFYNNQVIGRELRQALTQSINTRGTRRALGHDYRYADSPLLPSHLGYRTSQLGFDQEAARAKFAAAELEYRDGRLYRDDEPFSLRIVTQDSYGYPAAAENLRQQWEAAGVEVVVTAVAGIELQEEYLRPRNFDILLFGIGIGLDIDPDVYAYWHSSQAKDPGRNVSQYDSEVADTSLEDGRTRTDSELRAAKYETFQNRWRADAPALALYRLHAYYVNREELQGLSVSDIAQPADRYHNVADWTINTQPTQTRLLPRS